MKTLELREATASLADYAKKAAEDPVLVLSKGKPFAAVVSMRGVDLETAKVSMSPVFQQILSRSRQRQKAEGGLTSDELRKQLA